MRDGKGKMSPSPSQEQLLKGRTGSSEKLKTSSTEQIKHSPSSDKLKQSGSSEKLSQKPGSVHTPKPQQSKMLPPQSTKKEPIAKTPTGKAVAEKVAQLKEVNSDVVRGFRLCAPLMGRLTPFTD